MTRILVQRGSGSSSSSSSSTNPNRSSSLLGSSTLPPHSPVNTSQSNDTTSKEEDVMEVVQEQGILNEASEHGETKNLKIDVHSTLEADQSENTSDENIESQKAGGDCLVVVDSMMKGFGGLIIREHDEFETNSNSWNLDNAHGEIDASQPPAPPIPPPKPLATNSNSRRFASATSNPGRSGSSRRAGAWPVLNRTSPTGSRPSSPRAHCESEGYNSADEQSPRFGSSYGDLERERQFESDIRRTRGLEVRRMQADGNCLFRAIADQVYGDSEAYDLIRQMCIDYMERERDHFSQFITEGFTSYCKRKRRDKVYGNNVEIQALAEMYNRPIHIYSYSTESINIFHRSYNTDLPPIRLSFHHGNHYNSLVDPRRQTIGAGLGFSSLRGRTADKDQVKAAIKAQQDQQIDNALIAEGRFYSDLELTEKEIERMVMDASRADYLSGDKLKQQLGYRGSSTSGAEPSSSGARPSSGSDSDKELGSDSCLSQGSGLSSSIQMVLSMGFSYLQAIEAYSIFGDDVDSMVCYLLETSTGSSSRRKGKAAE